MKKRIIVLAALLLSGCASPAWLQNRAVCTVDGREAHVLSKWGAFSIGTKLAQSDADAICKR